MLLPRRKFLESSLLFGASVLILANSRPAFSRAFTGFNELPIDVLRDPVYQFSKETFEPYVGGYFQAPNARGELVALKLIKVDAYQPKEETKITTRSPIGTESFSLLFSAEAPLSVASIHPIKHGALGDFKLALTRKTGKYREIYYEAVFNRVR